MTDLVNGLIELLGATFLFLNCLTLLKDKKVAGVHVFAPCYFELLSFWFLYFYWMNHLNYSLIGQIFVTAASSWWVWLIFYFKWVHKEFIPVIKEIQVDVKVDKTPSHTLGKIMGICSEQEKPLDIPSNRVKVNESKPD